MHCLKELRTLEKSGKTPPKFKDYVPENLEVRALLSRDKNMANDLYKAAVADTLIITMKVHYPFSFLTPLLLDFCFFSSLTLSLFRCQQCLGSCIWRRAACCLGAKFRKWQLLIAGLGWVVLTRCLSCNAGHLRRHAEHRLRQVWTAWQRLGSWRRKSAAYTCF